MNYFTNILKRKIDGNVTRLISANNCNLKVT